MPRRKSGPGKTLTVNLQVSDAKGQGARAEITLAAVDEGICQLTRLATPDPWEFLLREAGAGGHGTRRLLAAHAGD